jgi:tellurite resistance protein TerC
MLTGILLTDGLKPLAASIHYRIFNRIISRNIFVIAIIFRLLRFPKIPTQSFDYIRRHFEGLMIFFGVLIIHKFFWATYLLASSLFFTAMKMLFSNGEKFEPKKIVCI